MTFRSAIYRGELVHARADALAHRAFTYPVYMAAIDLGELPVLDRELRLFSHGGRNVFALHDRDYSVDLAATVAGNDLPAPHTTRLVTNLRVFGYTFNPVSFFINYDAAGAITSAIAEVNNTYGGNFPYVLGPAHRLPDRRRRVGFRHVREFFVSPFLHGPAVYEFWFEAPLDGSSLEIEMHVRQPAEHDTRTFTARFSGRRTPMSDRALAGAAVRYPLMTAQVIGLIHYEAIKMRLAGIPYRTPGRDHRPLAR
ncbi:MAG: hypothetical protein JWO36_6942 [Myxococcales bacterium]|nr:hypothetical protein [Myxococcales bacterium]